MNAVWCRNATLVLLTVILASLPGNLRGAAELRPALPVHAWRGGQHLMGFLTVDKAGGLRFASLVVEKSAEPDRPGYWIEAWKVGQLGRLCPEALRLFELGEQAIVTGARYRRVLPARSIQPAGPSVTSDLPLQPRRSSRNIAMETAILLSGKSLNTDGSVVNR
jgi:hypothetical protein